FELQTDHRNLLYMEKSESPKIVRWRLLMQEFDYELSHIPGRDNVPADFMSRYGHVAVVKAIGQDVSKKDIVRNVHGRGMEDHSGIKGTLEKLRREGYYWRGIVKDVKEVIKSCSVCQKLKYKQRLAYPVLTTSEGIPFREIAIDAIGPIGEDKQGYKYILTCIDCFTRWVELFPLVSTGAEETMNRLLQLFCRYGLPEGIRSDNATEFVNHTVRETLALLGVRHHRIVPYHPEGNGIVERCNAEVTQALRAIVFERKKADNWSLFLPLVVFQLNQRKHRVLGVAPYELMFGRFPGKRIPEIRLGERAVEHLPVEAKKYVTQLIEKLDEMQEIAGTNQGGAIWKKGVWKMRITS
ncbi:hypothetical protein ADUPG1_013469, partial [Aduncisulcus paluster]